MNQEMYQEGGVEKSRTSRLDWSSSTTNKMSLKTMIEIIAKAGYEVKKIERDWGLGTPSRFMKVSHGKIRILSRSASPSFLLLVELLIVYGHPKLILVDL